MRGGRKVEFIRARAPESFMAILDSLHTSRAGAAFGFGVLRFRVVHWWLDAPVVENFDLGHCPVLGSVLI